ncbi:hypothetical protein CNR22_05750 [Sphingobacteriaceae bacterium]|nr:hypothetical protein CNR22_05750 [Sphingobacteriaceae bacterium]
MKKVYKNLLVAATGILAFSASAQVSIYGFSQYQGTYLPITGGTVFATSTTDDGAFVNPANPTLNQTTGPGIPIGFNFTFNFNTYDVFGIDNNGWIAFGQSALTPNPVNLNNTGLGAGISGASTAPAILQNRVSAFGRDLVSNNGSLRVQTVGSPPNRECVIQWTNYRVFLGNDFLNFQIRLQETTNVINIVYGSQTITSTTGGQVGIRGNSNADFNNRSVVSPTVWASSIPGTVNTDVCNINTSGLQPVSGQVYEWTPPPPCSGAPASNTVASTFSLICPGGASTLNLVNSYTNTGISYQWYVSDQSAVGPFTIVPTATNSSYAASNVTVTSYYQAVITCSVGPQSSTATPYGVNIAGVTINTVPYYEGFEGITVNNQLPNCSWAASNLPTINQTYTVAAANNRIPHTGSKFASFRFGTNAAGDYFYSNGVQMEPGVTYSAAVWYITDGALGWSNLSLNLGSTQSTVGLTTIASVTPVTGTFYQLLSNTFTVATSGIYYIAIKCIGNSTPNFLTFDDLSVTIPCSLNAPTVSLTTSPANLCSDQDITISATGGDEFTWSTGEIAPSITFIPYSTNVNISVVATNTASGCSTTVTPMLTINPSPVVSIYVSTPSVCLGSSASLVALGSATSYSWSTGSTNSTATVAPTVATSYTVTGTNNIGCKTSVVATIGVNPLPPVTAVSSAPNELCAGETATLTGSGAISYQWINNSTIILTQQALVNPTSSTVYTLTGTDFRGCSASAQVAVNVSACVGLNEISSELTGVNLYPNPTNGLFTVGLANGVTKQVIVTDVTGRVVVNTKSSEDQINVSVDGLAAGVYSVKITSGNANKVIKLIKN